MSEILIADDDPHSRDLFHHVLVREGHKVDTVEDGDAALRALTERGYDLVLSDIDMPGKTGIELLRGIRERDLDIPVILITGFAQLETAMAAVEHGAARYLTKPVELATLRDAVKRGLDAGRLARVRRDMAAVIDDKRTPISDLAGLETRFVNALGSAYVEYQPIVRWSTQSPFAYEALVRSAEPLMANPAAMFDAAERLGRTLDIGRRVRALAAERFHGGDTLLFINVHPDDLLDEDLYDGAGPLSSLASRAVLEITERSRLEKVPEAAARIARLRKMGFRIAIDDIGAGYAGLTSFAALEPDFMKLDGALIREIDTSETKRRLVDAMIKASQSLDVHVIAEGIERQEERDTLVALGCDLLQGFLLGRPAR